jgi:hypothetical protein
MDLTYHTEEALCTFEKFQLKILSTAASVELCNKDINKSRTVQNTTSSRKQQNDCYISKHTLKIFHQNIRGLRNKKNELLCHIQHDSPHVVCLSEHHLNQNELDLLHMDNYTLGSKYCRKNFQKGGVCIFFQTHLQAMNVNLDKFCIDRDIKICAIKLIVFNKIFYTIAVFRSPAGKFSNFLI